MSSSVQKVMDLLSRLMQYKLISVSTSLLTLYYVYKLFRKMKELNLKRRIKNSPYQPKIIIIGAGMSGICAAFKLKREMGYENFSIFERHSSVGGTWFVNAYPGIHTLPIHISKYIHPPSTLTGCQCDVPSVLYSFSFAQKHDWSKAYGTQQELLEYMRSVVKKFNLNQHIQFNTEVKSVEYDADYCKWKLLLANGKKHECNILIPCIGGLNIPKYPKIAGIDSFKGKSMHSGEWDNSYDIKNKRVAIFGSGCSALQITPHLAKQCKKLYVIARSPTYIFPKFDPLYGSFRHNLFYYLPIFMYLHRFIVFVLGEIIVYPLFLKKNTKYQQRAIETFLHHRNKYIPETRPELRDAVTPRGYTPGLKRISISNEYYTALQAENVEFVNNCNDSKVERITENGIALKDGEDITDLDCIVYATGFNVEEIVQIDMTGKDGQTLMDLWNQEYGPYAYKFCVFVPRCFVDVCVRVLTLGRSQLMDFRIYSFH